MLLGNFASTSLLTLRPRIDPVDAHDRHQHQHRGGDVELQLRDGEHDEQQTQRRRHEQPEHVAAGVHHVAHVAAHRALVARQQVGLLAGHHAFAAIGHAGAARGAFGLALVAAELGAGQSLAARPRLGRGHRRRRDRALLACASASSRLGVGRPLGSVRRRRALAPRPGRRRTQPVPRDRLPDLRVAFLAAQQLHSRQVTSRIDPVPEWPRQASL